MKLKIGILVLVIGVMCVGGVLVNSTVEARANIPSWANNTLEALRLFNAATDAFFVSAGADVRDRRNNLVFGHAVTERSVVPWVTARYGIAWLRAEYAGFAGWKRNIPGWGGSGNTHYVGICRDAILAHAWIRPWDRGAVAGCISVY